MCSVYNKTDKFKSPDCVNCNELSITIWYPVRDMHVPPVIKNSHESNKK